MAGCFHALCAHPFFLIALHHRNMGTHVIFGNIMKLGEQSEHVCASGLRSWIFLIGRNSIELFMCGLVGHL
eukprot:5317606-Amphidinium_carterae.1